MKNKQKLRPNQTLKLMDQVSQMLRYHHYTYRTERIYCAWIVRFIKFLGKMHPARMGKTEIEAFLRHLAVKRNVTASTQNQV